MKKLQKLREEFIQIVREKFNPLNGEDLFVQFEKETGKLSVQKDRITGGFAYWLSKHELYSDIAREIYIEEEEDPFEYLIKIQVKDLDKKYLINIPEEKYTEIIYIVNPKFPKRKATRFQWLLLNRRFIFKQLGLELQEQTKRGLSWYEVNQELKWELDLKGDTEKQTNTLSGGIRGFCEKLMLYLKVEYWGFVLDYLELESGERALIWDPKDFGTKDESKVMSLKGLDDYEKCQFFLIPCEKVEILKAVMKELIKRGYKKGYYGISMKGYGTTVVIKLMLRLRKVRNFRVLMLHDYDQNGLQILFDIMRYIDCRSIGINPDFLETFNIDENIVKEPFKGKHEIELYKGTISIINELNVDNLLKNKFRRWSKDCREEKIELNSIAAYNLRKDHIRSKVYDLVDCIVEILEDPELPWNINRYREPDYYMPNLNVPYISRPKFIEDITNEIADKISGVTGKLDEAINEITQKQGEIEVEAYREFNEYLDSKELRFRTDWKDLIKDKVNKMIETNEKFRDLIHAKGEYDTFKKIIRRNKEYKGEKVIKNAWNIIERQNRRLNVLTNKQTERLKKVVKRQTIICKNIIKQTPEYKELKGEVKEKKEDFIETNFENFMTELQDRINEIFEEPIED